MRSGVNTMNLKESIDKYKKSQKYKNLENELEEFSKTSIDKSIKKIYNKNTKESK
jgi:hypothetical protein